jgi:hypothetical protein
MYATNGAREAIAAWLAVRGPEPGALLAPVNKAGRKRPRRATIGAGSGRNNERLATGCAVHRAVILRPTRRTGLPWLSWEAGTRRWHLPARFRPATRTTTLLDLVAAVSSSAHSEADAIATVVHPVSSGRAILCGTFRGARFVRAEAGASNAA